MAINYNYPIVGDNNTYYYTTTTAANPNTIWWDMQKQQTVSKPYTWDAKYNETMRDARIKELENKLKSVVRKKIDKIQITSMADFAYFLDVLIKGMKEFIEENYEENTDNMQFLLDELEKELDQWIEVN